MPVIELIWPLFIWRRKGRPADIRASPHRP